MTASAGAWYRVGKVDVVSGSKAITGIGSGWQNDVVAIAVGDFFTLDSKTWYEVTAVISDTRITLDRNYEGGTASAQNYAIVRNTSGTILTRIAGQVSVQFNQKQLFLDELRTWLNSNSASETLTDSHGITQSLKTPSQMVRDHDNRLAELDSIQPFPWAMRKVEFEAKRTVNNELYAASGFVHKGKHRSNKGVILNAGEGLYTYVGVGGGNTLTLGDLSQGALGVSKSGPSVVNIAGVTTTLQMDASWGAMSVRLPPAEDGTRTYDNATGVSVTHATPATAFASETSTNKVVTNRVDMWGFEAYLREINDADPFVYANGLIQSRLGDINGVTTSFDNARPATYFAGYDGDTAGRGRGVNWQTASEESRIKIAGNPENNVFFDDLTGKFYQWCIRGRSFAGAGNGDWGKVNSNSGGSSYLKFLSFSEGNTAKNLVKAQGREDGVVSIGGYIGSEMYITSNATDASIKTYTGVFSLEGKPESIAIRGDCHFLVCGTINRLNRGSYHPSFNPSGAAKVVAQDMSASYFWYESLGKKLISLPDCFSDKQSRGHGQGAIGLVSGRPDGRFYDAIYASGQGGICRDMRYSAWGLKTEDFAEADLKVKSGEYRGGQKLGRAYRTTIMSRSGSGGGTLVRLAEPPLESRAPRGASFAYLYNINKGIGQRVDVNGNEFGWLHALGSEVFGNISLNSWEVGDEVLVLSAQGRVAISAAEDCSVSGEYTHTDVIGSPSSILLCDDLKNGWVGGWVPVRPDGSAKEFPFTNKLVANGNHQFTIDNTTFSGSGDHGADFSTIKNSRWYSCPANQIAIHNYTAKTVITKPSVNSEIYGGVEGLGSVYFTQAFPEWAGVGLAFSLIGKVVNSSGGVNELFVNNIPLAEYSIYNGGLGGWSSNERASPVHALNYNFSNPDNSPTGIKALNYSVAESQQGFINYAYMELNHNGTDWGDDGKIHLINSQATRTDDNGNTVVYGTARIVEPIGWIKNDK